MGCFCSKEDEHQTQKQQRLLSGKGHHAAVRPRKKYGGDTVGAPFKAISKIEDHYIIGKELGKGQFGTAYQCKEVGKAYAPILACKVVVKASLKCEDDVQDARNESTIMSEVGDHPLVVHLFESLEDHRNLYYVEELCSGGELFDRIIERKRYTEKDASVLFRSMVDVIAHCHSHGVIHRDLKPENFLFKTKAEDSPLMLTDFGLAIHVPPPGKVLQEQCGSAYYIAPEVLNHRYSLEADVWSLGVILYILLSGVPPFWDEREEGIFKRIVHANVHPANLQEKPWPRISEEAKGVIRTMLTYDRHKRPSAAQMLKDPWLSVDGVASDKDLGHDVIDRLKQFSAMNKMKKHALQFIANNMKVSEIRDLKQIFKDIDRDNSGTITYAELKDGIAKLGTSMTGAQVEELMKSVDFDGNGVIEYEEFVAATIQLGKAMSPERLRAAFEHFDKDNSGLISVDEIREALVENDPDCDVEALIKEIDKDGNGEIDYEEFCSMMTAGIPGRKNTIV